MLDKLGTFGLLGIVVALGGFAVVATQNLVLAGGLALVVAGLGLIVAGLLKNLMSALGMGGMM